ncbi:MAG: hypothetical protein J6C78_01010 [Muribaculaceae bacterium]|nr:hypothetical protein [Muribaculaceae bacterium]
MKTNIIHSIAVCLAALALPFMVACSSQEAPMPEPISEATLYMNIEQIGNTRAGTSSIPDNEKMHNVRIIVLHSDGTIEHNRLYPLNTPQEQKYIILKVKPDEKKRIFLFANENNVSAVEGIDGGSKTLTDFFDGYTADAPGFENAVNGLYFAPDYSGGKPIPMSSMYEIDFPKNDNFEGTFYVVRVATKFTINFLNWRGEEVTVEKFSISSYADKNFLMAHVNDSEQNSTLFKGKSWIDWLKEVSDASNENGGSTATETSEWLKDYELPSQANQANTYTHGSVVVGRPTVNIDNPGASKPGVAKEIPVFYLPESKNGKAETTDGEQEYAMTIKIGGKDEPFVFKLPNLKALFRNTHVVVNITMYHNHKIEVDVIPYSEVVLDPAFGVEIEEETQTGKE